MVEKLRCTVQCRADQHIPLLERTWAQVTKIPRRQFYDARVDPRTIGTRSYKKNYPGVCRIDYFSAHVYHELTMVGKIITGECVSAVGL